MPDTILIVDDNASQASMKEHVLQHKLHYRILSANGEEDAIDKVLSGRQPCPDIVLLDLAALGDAGLRTIRVIQSVRPDLPVIAFTGYGDHEQAQKALQAGARDFLTKPVMMERLKLSLQQALKMRRMSEYVGWLERKIAGHVDFTDIVGQSPALGLALTRAREAAASKIPVLITGEPGTGKELFARAIHGGGDRAGKPFVVVNCRMLSEAMAGAVLFGQDGGADRTQFTFGKLREAEHGTLLLKETALLSPIQQQQLVSMLEPDAAGDQQRFDVRLICTHTPTEDAATENGLKLQPLQRLKRLAVTLPPLKQRQGDVPILAEHFLALYSASENKYLQGLTERARHWLDQCPWPGNVGQLAHTIWRAVMLCDHTRLDVSDLQMARREKPAYSADLSADGAGAALVDEKGQVKSLKSVEQEAIRFALEHAHGCMTQAARTLGIGRSTLYRKVSELQMDGYISRANHTTRPMMRVSSTDRS